jgi:DNA-directed RNA polymerase III subunit RPC4
VEIIDMELVPEELGESAPTGLIRDRSISVKGKGKDKKDRLTALKKATMEVKEGEGMTIVKSEPVDELTPVPPPKKRVERVDDTMLSEDEDVDVDMDGNRMSISDETTPEVTPVRAVDLSESEGEEEEEDMTGDFIKEDGFVSSPILFCPVIAAE